MTIALYRRYRPERFADVIGQEHVTGPLQQALSAARVGHAYLFSGPRGCGKTTSARILARCLNCEQGPTPQPCGVCDSCVALARGGPGSVDVIEIDAASHGGVEDARDLREKASYGPAQARFKVYIIDEAHMVTPQGFNALLKIVEEPPEHVKFVFATTEPEKVIGTIRSRTHHYPFRLVPPQRLQAYLEEVCALEGVDVEAGVLSFVIRAGGGSVRDSLSVLDQLMSGAGPAGLTYAGAAALLGFTEGELLDATVIALAARDGAAMFRQIDRIVETGHDPRRFVEDLLERLRDLIVIAAVGVDDAGTALFRGAPQDQLDRMREQAAAFGPGELSYAADTVNTGLTEMTGATSPRLHLELICARLLLPATAGEHGLTARVDRLERRLEVAGAPGPPDAAAAPPSPAPGGPAATDTATPTAAATTTRDSAAARPGRPPRGQPGSGQQPHGQPGSGQRPPVPAMTRPATPPAAPRAPAGLDTDAMRRSWPDVLAKIFTIRRVTWTFLSTHAQVLDFDGERLLLGIATRGLATTFRQGHHHEVVRQALIEALGVDARVEGVPADDAPPAGTAGRGTSPGGGTGPGRDPQEAGPARPSGNAGSGGPAAAPERSDPPSDADAPPEDDEPPEPDRDEPSGATRAGPVAASTGPPAARGPAPPQPAEPAEPAERADAAGVGSGDRAPHAPAPASSSSSVSESRAAPTPATRGREAFRQARAARRSDGGVPGRGARGPGRAADDAAASVDDEDIEDLGTVGPPVIAAVLGGTVIDERHE